MRISGVDSTDLFARTDASGGSGAEPRQIVRVQLVNAGPDLVSDPHTAVSVEVTGRDVGTPDPVVVTGLTLGSEVSVEVPVVAGAPPGTAVPVRAIAFWPGGRAEQPGTLTVAEPGWVMWMVSHFHYDPVWWSTQGQFTQARLLLPDENGELPEVRTAFELVRLHLDAARRDPDYKFVLAELDYLKPHFDAHPEDRADLLDLIAAGRIELVGGSYNEPNTNLTCVESTIRNAVYGTAYQRDVLGGNPRTSWMLDAFGFDPAYPGIMAAAGLDSSSWARGPFHQWGPNRSVGDNRLMQFASEFEWLSPDGSGLLTSYMANHYGAGWVLHHAKTLAAAEADAYEQFRQLAPVAATRNVLLPVGADHVIPARWATAVHRDWNARYAWPRFVTAVPSEFFAAVRAEAAERGTWITPQTRDMNPVYTGKDVTYVDTKQAQRAAETAVLDGERLATLAWLAGAGYPAASLDKAWRQLVFGAHHDAITGSEGDQVYLDLLGSWREAWERGNQARTAAVAHLAGLADTLSLAETLNLADTPSLADARGQPDTGGHVADGGLAFAVVVVNSLSADRDAMATVSLELPAGWPDWLSVLDDTGAVVPFLADGIVRADDGALRTVTITFRAQVPGVGYRSYLVRTLEDASASWGWRPGGQAASFRLENENFLVEADPSRGGALSRVLDKRSGAELLQPGGGGNELMLQPEHPAHPRWAEGPWLLCPAGPGTGSTSLRAAVRTEQCPVGGRIVAEFDLAGLHVTQETLLWDGSERVEFRTHVDGSIGQDRLLRVLFPANVPGGLPVYQTAVAVIGRPPGPVDTDVAEHSYTLDCPANEWLGLGATAAAAVGSGDGTRHLHALGVAEVVAPAAAREPARRLVAALAGQGVTATCSQPAGPRYGYQELDSNLPDFRICLGGPQDNDLTAQVLASAGPAATDALAEQLAATGAARLWVPASRSRADAFGAGADLRSTRDLPVLIIAAADLAAEVESVVADLADAVVEVLASVAAPAADAAGAPETALTERSVALLNRGTPSGLVTPDGVITMALMRACSTWPSGVWIDGKKRTTPDGTSFSWQHWSHTFEYALTAGPGSWRTAGFPAAGQDYNHDLLTVTASLHAGPLPARTRLLSVEPATVALSALKPHGNPLAPAGSPDLSRRRHPAAARPRREPGERGSAGRLVHRASWGQRHQPVRGQRGRGAAARGRRGPDRRAAYRAGDGSPPAGTIRAADARWPCSDWQCGQRQCVRRQCVRYGTDDGGAAGACAACLLPVLAARQGSGPGRQPARCRAPVSGDGGARRRDASRAAADGRRRSRRCRRDHPADSTRRRRSRAGRAAHLRPGAARLSRHRDHRHRAAWCRVGPPVRDRADQRRRRSGHRGQRAAGDRPAAGAARRPAAGRGGGNAGSGSDRAGRRGRGQPDHPGARHPARRPGQHRSPRPQSGRVADPRRGPGTVAVRQLGADDAVDGWVRRRPGSGGDAAVRGSHPPGGTAGRAVVGHSQDHVLRSPCLHRASGGDGRLKPTGNTAR